MSNPLDTPSGQPVVKRNGAMSGTPKRLFRDPHPVKAVPARDERTLDAVEAMRARRTGRLVDDLTDYGMEDDG